MATDPQFLRAQQRAAAADQAAAQGVIDEGLRGFMLKTYNYMAAALALTAVVAAGLVTQPDLMRLFYTVNEAGQVGMSPLAWGVIIGELGLVFFLSARVHALKASTAQGLFWAYAALNGVMFSMIAMIYTGESIARVFFITAATFGAMSIYGYSTKRDLSGMGSFLFMGLIGIIIASVVNIFVGSSMMHFIISVIGVVIFTGLTAYDTQKIKSMYYYLDGGEAQTKGAIMGALTLYLDFINLFLMLLRLMGNRE